MQRPSELPDPSPPPMGLVEAGERPQAWSRERINRCRPGRVAAGLAFPPRTAQGLCSQLSRRRQLAPASPTSTGAASPTCTAPSTRTHCNFTLSSGCVSIQQLRAPHSGFGDRGATRYAGTLLSWTSSPAGAEGCRHTGQPVNDSHCDLA